MLVKGYGVGRRGLVIAYNGCVVRFYKRSGKGQLNVIYRFVHTLFKGGAAGRFFYQIVLNFFADECFAKCPSDNHPPCGGDLGTCFSGGSAC